MNDTKIWFGISLVISGFIILVLFNVFIFHNVYSAKYDRILMSAVERKEEIALKNAENIENSRNSESNEDKFVNLSAASVSTSPVDSTSNKSETRSAVGRDENNMLVVTYTESGFSPFIIEVTAGEPVRFVNKSNRAMLITSQFHPTAKEQNYTEFYQSKSLGRDGEFTFNFTRVGVWGYKNQNEEKHLGAVVVKPQKNI